MKQASAVHHQNVVPASDDDEEARAVAKHDIVKGYEYEKGQYIAIDPDEIKRLRLKSQKTLEVVQFVGHGEVDLGGTLKNRTIVVPKDDGQAKVLAILRKALEETQSIGLGEITFSGREHLVALAAPVNPEVRGLMLYVMRYEEELRDPSDYYSGISESKIDAKQVALARQLIESYRAPFNPSQFKDDYEASLRELAEAKLHHRKPAVAAKEPKRAKVIDLMDALKKSVAAKTKSSGGEDKSASARPRQSPAKKRKVA